MMLMLVLFPLGLLLLGLFGFSVAWVWRDANRRGQPGFIVAVLVAFLWWPLSLIVWLLARPKPNGVPTGSGRGGCLAAIIALIAVIIAFVVILLALFFGIRRVAVKDARESDQRAACMNNERKLAMAYLLYVEKYSRCPQTFAALREFGVTDTMLHCPAALEAESPGSCSYALLQSTNATDVISRENRSNHRGKGGSVAYRDGHVECTVGR